jgi:hypothetical protein
MRQMVGVHAKDYVKAHLGPVGSSLALLHSFLGLVPAVPLMARSSRLELLHANGCDFTGLLSFIPLSPHPVSLLLQLLAAALLTIM